MTSAPMGKTKNALMLPVYRRLEQPQLCHDGMVRAAWQALTYVLLALALVPFSGSIGLSQEAARPSALVPQAAIAEALASPYGQGLIEEFAEVVLASAAPSCAKKKQLNLASVKASVRNLILFYGARVKSLQDSQIDSTGFALEFETQIGQPLDRILVVLQADPVMADRWNLYKSYFSNLLLDFVTVKIDQVAIIERLLKSPFSTLATARPKLMELLMRGEEQRIESLLNFDGTRPNQLGIQMDKIAENWPLIMASSQMSGEWVRLGPQDYVPNLTQKLGELCVLGSSK
jgi:hypothetical protein